MQYTVFGRRGAMGRVASHTRIEGVIEEIEAMTAAGFTEVQVGSPYRKMAPASAFLAEHGRERELA
ncbi:MAG: hypothetical protein AB1942_11345 [Pseudomonadota bacterium]